MLRVTIQVNDEAPLEALEIVNLGPAGGAYGPDDGPGGDGLRVYKVRRADLRPPSASFTHWRRDGALVCVALAIEALVDADEDWAEEPR